MYSRRNGFTLIELMITMAIMVILVAVAIVSLRGTQANGRDAERTSDIATISRGLEQRYNIGISEPEDIYETLVAVSGGVCDPCFFCPHTKSLSDVKSTPNNSIISGSYPSTDEIKVALGLWDSSASFCVSPDEKTKFITTDLPGTSDSTFIAPNATSSNSFVFATSASVPSKSTVGNSYYYQPLTANNSVCTTWSTTCVKYNLYYVSESDDSLVAIRSKHQ